MDEFVFIWLKSSDFNLDPPPAACRGNPVEMITGTVATFVTLGRG